MNALVGKSGGYAIVIKAKTNRLSVVLCNVCMLVRALHWIKKGLIDGIDREA